MKTITLHHVLAFIVTCVFLFCEVAVGQAVYGNINGTVNDPSGAAVANAAITITDMDRGINYKTTANESGSWAWNAHTGARFWSQETFRIFGCDPEKVKPTW